MPATARGSAERPPYTAAMGLRRVSFEIKTMTVRRASARYLADLTRTESLPPGELQRLQNTRAAEIARFAATHTRYYARLFADADIDLDALEDLEQWRRIPITDRATVKADSEAFITPESNPRTAQPAKTGGSTGEPLQIQHDARVPTLALAWRIYRWWGVQPWDNLARLARWGFGRADEIKNRISWWPSRQVYLDASMIDEPGLDRFYAKVVRTRPALIEGYVGALLEFADYLEARGLSIPAPRAVATTAAPLPESTRERIQSVLGAPVYDEYRGSEARWMAAECAEQNGLHVFADARRIEIVDDDGNPLPVGTVGNIVVTDLTNRVFPLIRYRLGDRGALRAGVCPCGRTLPLMEPPEGRITDVLRLPSGAALNHRLMAMFSAHPSAVRLFQIHQLADYSITIRVVRGNEPSAEEYIEAAVGELRARVHNEVPIRIEYVDTLPYTGGKTKYVISDVPPKG